MAEPTSCCVEPGGYCARVDTMFNLPGVHVLDVAWRETRNAGAGGTAADGGDRPGRDRLPGLRGDRRAARPTSCGGCTTFRRSVRRCSWCGGSAATGAPSRRARSAGSARTIALAVPPRRS